MFLDSKRFVIVIFNIIEFLMHRFGKDFNLILAIDYKFHDVGGVFALVEVEEHFSKVRIGEGRFISRRKLMVGMVLF